MHRSHSPLPQGRRSLRAVCLALAALLPLHAFAAEVSPRVDFNFQVRPLLSDRCFKCHGPDAKARKAGLRLDSAETAFAPLKKRPEARAIVPGRPEESEMYRRITSSDPDEMMPPPDSLLNLSKDERDLLRRWIAEGAEYKAHWGFIPVGDAQVPEPSAKAWTRNPIDAFVLARLEREGLNPAQKATRETLIRRLSFDLMGLPPDLEEIDRFLADDSPNAYERLVDRLLDSAAYGERRANEWLDLSRYADTYGYQSDVERDMSPWRDWVIRAFNENLPYDQFVVWQIAGDLLPSPTRDQVLATAFNRLHRQTNEGGSIDEEFRIEYVADRVRTAGTAFLGLTLECARCHDHKYDPITQKDYYRLFAFFANIDESGLYSHFTQATPAPGLLLYPDGVEARHRALKEEIAAKESRLEAEKRDALRRFDAWLSSGGGITAAKPVASFAFDEVKDNATPNAVDPSKPGLLVEGPELVDGKLGKAMRFSGDNSLVLKGSGDFNRVTPFSIALWIRPTERQERSVVLHRSRAWSDSGSRGYEVVLESGQPSFALIHFWPGNAIKVRAKSPVSVGEWTHLTVTYDGSSRASGLRIYVNGEPAPLETVRDNLYKDILHRGEWGDADVGGIDLTLAGRFRDSGFRGGAIDDLRVFDLRLTPGEVRALAGRGGETIDREALFDYFAERVDEPCSRIAAELKTLRADENRLVNDVREIMVMREMPERRPAYVLKRGAYHSPGEPVEPGVPERIFPFANDLPRNRLGLARWMVDPKNPLLARVEVNRVWRTLFGRGLVATSEDFGSQGQLPAHPELLDWLAKRFVDGGWDVKALHRLIATSETYRQSSRCEPEKTARDPENRLLSRGPKLRLEAEQLRDNALAVSGLLSRKVGGPSVKPYQPAGLWEEAGTGKTYVQDQGEKLYRRSLYTFWRRTAPPPTMITFDATSREVCAARRETTATPLQALVLLNDPQIVEAGRAMAELLLRESPGDVGARIERGFRLATGRRPDAREAEILRQLHAEQLARFQKEPDAAAKYLKIGDRPADAALPLEDLAAMAVLTNALMNLDEFVVKR